MTREQLQQRQTLERRQNTTRVLIQHERRRTIDRRVSNLKVNHWLATFHAAKG